MPSRLGLVGTAVMALSCSTSGLWAQDTRSQNFYIWPDAGPYLNRQLGSTVAADGDNLVLSLQYGGDAFDGGSIVFMRRVSGGWANSWSELERVDGPASGAYQLGGSLAMDGERVLARRTEFGADPTVSLYNYVAGSDSWLDAVVDVAAPVGASDAFGQSLSIEGDLLAVGDPSANRVYLYRDTGGATTLVDTVMPVAGLPQAFGTAISMSNDVLAVGDPSDGPGRVDLYQVNAGAGATHITQVDIGLTSIGEGDAFGIKLALDGNVLAIGATGAPPTDPGHVLIYEYEPAIDLWMNLVDDAPYGGLGGFPASIDVEGGMVLVGAPGTPFGGEEGSAMVYRRTLSQNWIMTEVLALSSDGVNAYAGRSVALAYGQALVGAPGRSTFDGGPQNTGAIACYNMDCDNDGVPDVEEIALGTEVDYDEDGVPDYCELDEYVLVPLDFPTIQAAIAGAAGRTILLEPGTYVEEVVVDGTDIDIRAFVPGSPPVWSAGFEAGVALDIDNASAQLMSIVFDSNMHAIDADVADIDAELCVFMGNGHGAYLYRSDLNADTCRFEGNVAIDNGGSAIRVIGGVLYLQSCEFIDNGGNAPSSVSSHYGGAIRLETDPDFSVRSSAIRALDCMFSGNSAEYVHVSEGAFSGHSSGGVVYGRIDLNSYFVGCTFEENRTRTDFRLTPTQGGSGHASCSVGEFSVFGTLADTTQLTFSDCELTGNELRALEFPGGSGHVALAVGAISVYGSNSRFEFNNSTVENCRMVETYLDGSSVDLTDILIGFSVVSNVASINTSDFTSSGGMHVFELSSSNNSTSLTGCDFNDCGRILVETTTASVVNSVFDGTCLDLLFGSVAACSFERIASNFDHALFLNLGPYSIAASDFHQIDVADSVIGGGTEASPIVVSSTTICGNSSPAFESDAFWTDGGGNTVEGGGNGAADCSGATTRLVPGDHATIDEALLAAGNGDTIQLAAGTYSETIDARGFSEITIIGAGSGSTVITPEAGQPGVLVWGGLVDLRDFAITDAVTGIDADRGTVLLTRMLLEDNMGSCGGALRLGEGSSADGDGADAVLTDTVIRSNTSSGDGGGICVGTDASLQVTTSQFDSNDASGSGGAIHFAENARGGSLASSSFASNDALQDGGGVNIDSSVLVDLQSCSFTGNTAGRFGGGANVISATFAECTFTSNSAALVGGGVRSNGISTLENCGFQLNVAGVGGGLAASAIETYVDGFTACGNIGGDWYGNVLDIDSSPLFCSSDCNSNGIPDKDEIAGGLLADCNGNSIPDVCEDLADLDLNGVPDECDTGLTQLILIADLGTVTDLAADGSEVLVRPLFRSGERTHDILVLVPSGLGAISTVVPDGLGGYVAGSVFSGTTFEGCCPRTEGGLEPECLNNGPAEASSLSFARGDIIISHLSGDTGLYDEDFQMYVGCGVPSGSGLPSPITDYDLTPDTDTAISVRYVEEEEKGGLASSVMPLSVDRAGQTLTAIPASGGGPKSTSGRRGSGQGGTGPYPGEDAVNDYDLSIKGIATGNFNGDASDDLVLLHPEEGLLSVRNFTGLADFIDPDSGENIPSGATWSEPVFTETTDFGVAVVTGQFVDLAGEEDDGLDDVAVVVDTVTGLQLVVWASSAADTLVQVGSPYALLAENFALGKSRVASDGTEVVLIAQQGVKGMTYLDYVAYDAAAGAFQTGWVALEFGGIKAISTAPSNFGVSAREVVAVLVDVGETTSVHLFELGQRPPHPIPDNDECSSPIELDDGDNAFTTLGATDSALELPVECESEGSTQLHKDTWYTWLASCSGQVTVSTCGTADFDTWLVAYEGGCDGFVIACNDEDIECAENTSKMTFEAVEGTTYHVRVGSRTATVQGSGILTVTCPSGSVADLNGDGTVDGADLASLLGGWGQPGPTDLNGDGTTDGADLATLLGEWTI